MIFGVQTYDGTTTAATTSPNLVGVLGTDEATLTRSTASFANKNVGSVNGKAAATAKTANVTGAPLNGQVDNKSRAYGQTNSAANSSPNQIGDIVLDAQGAHVRFAGIPGCIYIVERSNPSTDWTVVGSVVAPENGLMEFLDQNPPAGPVYYRTSAP